MTANTNPPPETPGLLPAKHTADQARATWVGVLLALLTCLVYSQVVRFGFSNFDDFYLISTNPAVASGLTLRGLWWGLTTSYFEYWHPVTWWSHMLDCELFGMSAGFHHLMSVALHVANTLLLFGVLRRMTGALQRSAVVAALFALHPLHVESVVWLAERKDVLSTFFWLLCLRAYVAYVKTSQRRHYRWALFFFALGLMSKPMVVTLPFGLLLLDYWPLQRFAPHSVRSTLWPLIREKISFFVLMLASCASTYFGVRAGNNILSAETVPWQFRLANVPVSYARYIGKMFWPADLAVLYPMPDHWAWWLVGGSVLALLLISAWVVARARSAPYLIFGWLWFLGTLVPTIGLVPVGFQSIADRYTYVPLIGLFVMVVWGAVDLAQRWPLPKLSLRAVGIVVVVGCALGTWKQLRHWQNDIALWSHVIRVTGDNARARYNLGLALHKSGNVPAAAEHYQVAVRIQPDHLDANINLGHTLALLKRPAEATNYLSRGLALAPGNERAHQYMGFALSLLGDLSGVTNHYAQVLKIQPTNAPVLFWDARAQADLGNHAKALEEFQMFLQLEPHNAPGHAELGKVHFARGNLNEAIAELELALPFMPGDPDVELKLGAALARQGRFEEAVAHLTSAVQGAPDLAEAHIELGVALSAQGRMAQAVEHYRRAAELKANSPLLLNNLAWILATHPEAALRNGDDAVRFAAQACALTTNEVPVFLGTLAAAYAEAGQFDQAVATAQKARERALSLGQTNLAELNQKLLEGFKAGQPYRGGQ